MAANVGIQVGTPGGGGPAVNGTTIQGNELGSVAGLGGNSEGIVLDNATNSVVGNNDGPGGLGDVQAHPELGNVIGGSGSQAIELTDGTTGSIVAGNFIGVDRGGAATPTNQRGIYVSASAGNQIGPGNTIAHAFEDGIRIDGFFGAANGNRIVANSTFDSGRGGFGGLGIDLQSNGNDTMPSPFLDGVTGGTVSGSYSGDGGGSDFFYEAFVSPSCSGQYANGAGRTYVNFVETGAGTFEIPLSGLTPGEGVTVTVDGRGHRRHLGVLELCHGRQRRFASGSIAFESNRTGNSQIWVMNPDGSNSVQLTHDTSRDRHAAVDLAGRPHDRLPERRQRHQPDLGDQRRRQPPAPAHVYGRQPAADVLAGRDEGRLRQQPQRELPAVRHERRTGRARRSSHTPTAASAARAGAPTGRRSPSTTTRAEPTRSTRSTSRPGRPPGRSRQAGQTRTRTGRPTAPRSSTPATPALIFAPATPSSW